MDYRLLIITSRGLYVEPYRTLERVRDALRERGVRVPSRFKNEWRRHFPVADDSSREKSSFGRM